jgi:hypothetical protein
MTFQNSNKTALSGASADAEWESLVPKNNGFLTKKIGNNTIHFGISAFHAIHCLDTLRRTVEVQFDVASAKTMASAQSNPGENSFYYLQHCLIYLREMVMCDADPTLEHDVLYQNGMTIMGGDGMTHTCRDFKALSAMSDESEVTAGTGCTGLGV